MNPRLRNEALIYTNWRGKNFIIDQAFVDDLKRLCEADGLEPGEMDFLTPEMLLEMLPTKVLGDMSSWKKCGSRLGISDKGTCCTVRRRVYFGRVGKSER